jgi:hypothetical protein
VCVCAIYDETYNAHNEIGIVGLGVNVARNTLAIISVIDGLEVVGTEIAEEGGRCATISRFTHGVAWCVVRTSIQTAQRAALVRTIDFGHNLVHHLRMLE